MKKHNILFSLLLMLMVCGFNPVKATINITSMDDPDTENQDGYSSGSTFEVRIWKSGVVYENVEMETLSDLKHI
jgi:hypothetical protein